MKQKNSQGTIQSTLSSKQSQSYAPFGSVASRQKKKKKGLQQQQLGPGAYDIAFPIIKPLIQTIKKKNNNIIVKLAHLGTSSFQGEKQRFTNELSSNEYTQVIGPGKYSPQKCIAYLQNSRVQKSFQLPKRKSAGTQLARFIKNRQRKAATFSQVKRIQIEEYVQMPTADDKQNSKSKKDIQSKNKIKGAFWSMMKQSRIQQVKNPYENIGPGHYYVDDFVKQQKFRKIKSISDQYPAFRSESIRSFFDGIRFETNQQKKALLREACGYKSHSIGPGTYDISSGKSKQNKFQFFGSTVQRG